MSWIAIANVGDWSNITPFLKALFTITVWIYISVSFMGSFVLTAVGITFLKPFDNLRRCLIIFPSLWIIAGYLGSWLFSVVTWSSDGNGLNTLNSIGNLGLPAAMTPLAFLSRFVGLYGLAAIVVAINVVIWYSARSKKPQPVIWALGLLVITVGATHLLTPVKTMKPIMAAAQQETNAALTGTRGLEADYSKNALPTNVDKVDILVLPEYASLFSGTSRVAQQTALQHILKSDGSVIYGSGSLSKDGRLYNQIRLANANGVTYAAQEKTYLVPFGEFIPGAYRAGLNLLGFDKYLSYYAPGRMTQRGSDGMTKLYTKNDVQYGSLACTATATPSLYRSLAAQGANVLTNSASLSFTQAHSTLQGMTVEQLHFEAVANAKPMVVSTRGGHAYIIDHNGATKAQTKVISNTLIYSSIQPTQGRTLYTILGEYVLWVAGAILAGITFVTLSKKYTR